MIYMSLLLNDLQSEPSAVQNPDYDLLINHAILLFSPRVYKVSYQVILIFITDGFGKLS